MALTYTEIEQQKNTRIVIFFLVVVFFYFVTALLLTFIVKAFLIYYMHNLRGAALSISGREAITILWIALVAAGLHILYSMKTAMKFQMGRSESYTPAVPCSLTNTTNCLKRQLNRSGTDFSQPVIWRAAMKMGFTTWSIAKTI